MHDETLTQTIRDAIISSYGSLQHPNFALVQKRLTKNTYANFIYELASHFSIKDITDSNYDFSFNFNLFTQSTTYLLQISVVGPFIVLLNDLSLVTAPRNSTEKFVFSRLLSLSLKPLNQDILLQKVPLELDNTTQDQTVVYQALFSDTDVLPFA